MARKPVKKRLITLHLVEGDYEIVWYKSDRSMRQAVKGWPPQSQGGCELRIREGETIPYCSNESCKGNCMLNLMPGGDGNIYYFCTCRPVKA